MTLRIVQDIVEVTCVFSETQFSIVFTLQWLSSVVHCMCVRCVYSGVRQRVGSEMLRLRLRRVTRGVSRVVLPGFRS